MMPGWEAEHSKPSACRYQDTQIHWEEAICMSKPTGAQWLDPSTKRMLHSVSLAYPSRWMENPSPHSSPAHAMLLLHTPLGTIRTSQGPSAQHIVACIFLLILDFHYPQLLWLIPLPPKVAPGLGFQRHSSPWLPEIQ